MASGSHGQEESCYSGSLGHSSSTSNILPVSGKVRPKYHIDFRERGRGDAAQIPCGKRRTQPQQTNPWSFHAGHNGRENRRQALEAPKLEYVSCVHACAVYVSAVNMCVCCAHICCICMCCIYVICVCVCCICVYVYGVCTHMLCTCVTSVNAYLCLVCMCIVCTHIVDVYSV